MSPRRLREKLKERKRWLVVALLFLLSAINYLDRQALSVLAPLLRDHFGFSAQQYSYVVTSFLVAYLIGYGFCGRVLDRVGVKIGIAAALAFWSLAGMLHAAAVGWKSLAAFRFLLGLGESFNAPGGGKAIGEWVPRRERALSMAVFSTGNIAGAVLAPPLVTFLALRLGWQSAFLITGALGFVWLAAWARFYDAPERHRGLSETERAHILAGRGAAGAAGGSAASLLRNPYCYGLFFARLLTDPVPFFFSFWLPEYLHRNRDFSMALIGLVAWIPYLAADAGGLSGGAISDWLLRRGLAPRDARFRVMLLAALTTPLAAVAVRADSAAVSIGCIAAVLAAHSCWIVNLLTSMTEAVPQSQAGSVIGLSGMGGAIGGIIATLLTGRIVSTYGYVPVFTTLAFLHITAYVFLAAVLRRQARREKEA